MGSLRVISTRCARLGWLSERTLRAERRDVSRKSPNPEDRSRRSRKAATSMSLQRASMKYRSRIRSLDRAGISGAEGDAELFMVVGAS